MRLHESMLFQSRYICIDLKTKPMSIITGELYGFMSGDLYSRICGGLHSPEINDSWLSSVDQSLEII